MATINLGNIKFNWKGTYAGGTAYVVDDVVSYSGSSYICKLASTGNLPTNGTYWDVMSQAGTDIGTTITTQGDILYRDGSGLQRLGAGTSGQLLTTGGSGANPSWTTVDSGGVIQTKFYNFSGTLAATNSSWGDLGSFSLSITPTSASNKILLWAAFGSVTGDGNNTTAFRFTRGGTGVGIGDANGSRERAGWRAIGASYSSDNHAYPASHVYVDSPSSTSAITYKIQNRVESGTLRINRANSYSNDSETYNGSYHSTFIAQEIKA